jgi:hypothetical protein
MRGDVYWLEILARPHMCVCCCGRMYAVTRLTRRTVIPPRSAGAAVVLLSLTECVSRAAAALTAAVLATLHAHYL